MRLQPELRITEFPRRFLLSQPANASNPRCSAVTIYAISVEAAAVELRAPITGTAVRRPLGRRDRLSFSGRPRGARGGEVARGCGVQAADELELRLDPCPDFTSTGLTRGG